MKRLLRGVVDHPLVAGGLVLVATVAFALHVPSVEIDTSAEGLMVERDPARQQYEEAKRRFGSDILTVVLVKADDVFMAPVLGTIQRLSDALARFDGVVRVESLTTVSTTTANGDVLDTHPLVGPDVPTAAADLARIRSEALRHRVFVGNIVAADGRAAALNVYTRGQPRDMTFNEHFSNQVDLLVAKESATGLTVFQVGPPLTKVALGDGIKYDRGTLTALSFPVLLVTLLLCFRMLQAAVIPVVTGGISILWTLGLMALSGLPLTTLTVVILPLLITVGFAEDVHMLSEYYGLLEQGLEKQDALHGMIDKTLLPITITTATTVLGFASLATTDIPMLIQFGHASSMGLTVNFLVTLVVVPSMLQLWPVPRRLRTRRADQRLPRAPVAGLPDRIGEFALRHRGAVFAASACVALASTVGLFLLRVDTDFYSFFPKRSFIRERLVDLHASLSGGLAFSIIIDTGREDGIKDPDLLKRIVALQSFLAGTGPVDKTVSVTDYIRTMHREMNGGDPAFEAIPDTREEVAQYLLLLEGKELARFVDFTAAAANVVVRHNITGSWELSAFLRRVDDYVATAFPATVTVRSTGESILIRNAADYMAVNEITSFAYTFVLIAVVHAALFRSLSAGLLSLVPNVIPILFNFGLMGFLGIPLNVGTAMIATIAIGIAVDDTVHCMVTYRRELAHYRDRRLAMLSTLRIQARPIVSVSVALAAGFLVLASSNFTPTVHFGTLSAVVMLVAMVFELVLTPVLMYSASGTGFGAVPSDTALTGAPARPPTS